MELALTFLILVALGALIVVGPTYIRYHSSTYGKASGNTFRETVANQGVYGEFMTYYTLEKIEGSYKLLSNLYIPRKNGTTTEIDLMMIHKTGIYVVESKNYSGWIYGHENQKYWVQTLESKKKNRFYNPIWQNEIHIKALKYALQRDDGDLFNSLIVFSERCTLKEVTCDSLNVAVMKRNKLKSMLANQIKVAPSILTDFEMNKIYYMLKTYANADESVKIAHIESVKKRVRW
ncbi:nuclease-related domain-containing protein [Alkalihalophilus pseudofirmus]|uniref:nuclease-related domain-containing protein n=1 Tax=Alkalihalophilus pseudofirmus TaxID=79885 RepID=UPI00259B3189|nr:nuclease-related domain-containing protein [Alkalihalophilus pseudofirmus]WEG16642.1 nuclease-related domain-containing protein [Alkalihalophilus pseudofirmus]